MIDALSGNTGVHSLTDVSGSKLGHTASVQFMFAMLQVELAQSNKGAALNKIEGIKSRQEESAKITDAINQLRNARQCLSDDKAELKLGNRDGDAKTELATTKKYIAEATKAQARAAENSDANKTESGEKESTMMTVEMENYFKDHGIDYDDSGTSRRQNYDEWQRAINALRGREAYYSAAPVCNLYGIDVSEKFNRANIDTMIASLEAKQQSVSSDIQQEMVYVNDFMGQYNSYTQGSSSMISQANDTLKAVARGG